MNKRAKSTKGFTLIEVLIVVGIIAILVAMVLVAVNPAKNFRNAANTQRAANVNAIMNAIGQYTVDYKGDTSGLYLPAPSTTVAMSSTGMSNFSTFCSALVPSYIGALPADPSKPKPSLRATDCTAGSGDTGYALSVDGTGHLTISAPSTVDVDTGNIATTSISVTR